MFKFQDMNVLKNEEIFFTQIESKSLEKFHQSTFHFKNSKKKIILIKFLPLSSV